VGVVRLIAILDSLVSRRAVWKGGEGIQPAHPRPVWLRGKMPVMLKEDHHETKESDQDGAQGQEAYRQQASQVDAFASATESGCSCSPEGPRVRSARTLASPSLEARQNPLPVKRVCLYALLDCRPLSGL